MPARTHMLQIRTPEGITFALQLAGPVTRFLARAIDFACVAAAIYLIAVVNSILGGIDGDLAGALAAIAYFALDIGYAIAAEWFWRGQTIGKRLLRLRVVDADGLNLQFNQVVVRNLLRFIDQLPLFYLVGGVACLANSRSQRLGDLAANTIVLREPALDAPDLDQLLAGKFNSLRDHPHLAARLRQKISPAEAALALRALLRRDELEAPARVDLFAELAGHFRSLVAFPPECVEGIPDERYVCNVLDIVFRPNARPSLSLSSSSSSSSPR